jgi:hypothetical protein
MMNKLFLLPLVLTMAAPLTMRGDELRIGRRKKFSHQQLEELKKRLAEVEAKVEKLEAEKDKKS